MKTSSFARASKLLISVLISTLSAVSSANVLGGMQTFSPTADLLDFETVHSGRTLKQKNFNLGLFVSYDKNDLQVFDNPVLLGPQYRSYESETWAFNFSAAWGVTDEIEVFYQMPGVIAQESGDDEFPDYFITEGIHTHRPGLKVNFLNTSAGSTAVIGSVDFPVTENDPYVGANPEVIYNIELAHSVPLDRAAIGFNIGYRARQDGDIPPQAFTYQLQDQVLASGAFMYRLTDSTRAHAELFGAFATDSGDYPETKHTSSGEGLLGLSHDIKKWATVHLGGTLELMDEGYSPDWRVYAGLNVRLDFADKKEPEQAPLEPINEFMLEPEDVEIVQGEQETFRWSGGKRPYRYKLSRNFGRFDGRTRVYTAPDKVGNVELTITDADGNKQVAYIKVIPREKPAQKITVHPASVQMLAGGDQEFSISGGEGTFTYQLVPEFGDFDEETLTYQAPTVPGRTQLIIKDGTGLSATVPIVVRAVPKEDRQFTVHGLNFVFGTADLVPASVKKLEDNLAQLKKMKIRQIVVVGHTDSIGSEIVNLKLSRKRAGTVAEEIRTRLNLDDDQVDAVGYGETAPIATNKTDEGRAKNRRVDLKVYIKQ